MTLFASLRERLHRRPVPPRCFACTQDVIPLEALGADRYLCVVCAKDFEAVPTGDDWRVDLRPCRRRRRGR